MLEIGRPTDCRFRKLDSGVSMVKPAKDRMATMSPYLSTERVKRAFAAAALLALRWF